MLLIEDCPKLEISSFWVNVSVFRSHIGLWDFGLLGQETISRQEQSALLLGQFSAVILLNRNIPRAKTKCPLVSYVTLSVIQSPSAWSFLFMSLLLHTKHSFTPFSLPFFSTLLPGTCEKTGSAVWLFLFTIDCSTLCQDSSSGISSSLDGTEMSVDVELNR